MNDFYVSTEDNEIAEAAKKFGAKVLKRPAHLAQDHTTTLEVLQHVLTVKKCDAIVVLQPTSPLRNHNTIDNCIQTYNEGNYDTLATGYNTKIIEYGTHNNMRRQDIQGFFYDDGNIYIIDRDVISAGRWFGDKICKYVLEKELNYEIDDDIDSFVVEKILEKRIREKKQPE